MAAITFAWPEGKSGAFTASYDDGVPEDRRLVAIFNRCGIRGTWNLNASRLAAEEIEGSAVAAPALPALYAGHEVACHGLTHPFLDRLPDERILQELVEDRRRLEAAAGYPVKGMSLPYGAYDRRVLPILRVAGLVHCRTTLATNGFGVPVDFLEWHPTCHHKADLPALWQRFRDAREPHKLFSLWGHSYEFGRENNWERIETFGETVRAAAAEGWLWCATNMEIYEYVSAWRDLWCSLDGRSLRNTRGATLWLRAGERLLSLAPGATVCVA